VILVEPDRMVIDSKESRFKVASYLVLNFNPDRNTELAHYNARQRY
jgi:hypothetical protein